MKREAIVCPVLVLLFLVSVFHVTYLQLPSVKGAGNDQVTEDIQPKTIEHRITGSELQLLKSKIGVAEEGENYNQLVYGHGTGLAPPSEADWEKIEKEAYVVNQVTSTTSLPSNVDNSAKPWFPPIGNQGSQGSCVAWAVGYYTKTFQEAKEHNWNLSGTTPNEIMSPSFIYNLIDSGKDGGSGYYDAINLVCSVGDCSLAKMPYNAADCTSWPSEQAWSEAPLYRGDSSGYSYMILQSDLGLANLKSWLASGNLAILSVDASKIADPFWGWSNLDSNDMLTLDNYVNPSPDHAGTIVGYNDNFAYTEQGQTHYGAFKIANSWGIPLLPSPFGWEHILDGCYWISYDAMEQRVGYCMYYRDRTAYVPTLTASFEIEHPMRGECSIVVGMGTHDNPMASKTFTEYIEGGNQPFCSNNIVFDITEFENAVPNFYGKLFFLSVYDTGPATGTILHFSVENFVSSNPPVNTVNGGYVFADLTLEGPSGQVCFSVEPLAVAPLADVDPSINGLETPSTPSPIGQNFAVQIHLRDATLANVPAGVAGVEVFFYFSNILSYAVPTSFVNKIGQLGGVLTGPSVLYAINPGFYDAYGNLISSAPYAGAAYFKVEAVSTSGSWNNLDGVVAEITFQIIGQPSSPQSDFYAPLQTTYTDLADANANSVPFYVIPGTVHIDTTAQVCFSVEPLAVAPLTDINASINGLETPSTPSPMGQDFTVAIKLYNVTTSDVSVGIAGVEVILTWNNTLIEPVSFVNEIGQPGGVLAGSILYAITPGFFDAAGNSIATGPYTNATQFEVAADSVSGAWWGDGAEVANITFQITGQPSSPQPDFYSPLQLTFVDVADMTGNSVPCNVVQGTVHIDASPAAQTYLVVRGAESRIYYRASLGDSWGDWNVLPGATCDSPTAAVYQGQLCIVVRGMDGNTLWYGNLTNPADPTSFSGWTLLSGATPSTPTLASNGTVLCLVVRGEDNSIYYRCYNGSWGSWFMVPTGATLDSPAVAMIDNNLHIVVRGMDDSSLWDTIVNCNGSVIRNWSLLSGATPSKPVLACSSSDNVCLVVRGMDNRIYYKRYTGSTGSWGDWNALPTGATSDGPGATVVGNELCTIVRGMDGSTLWCADVDLGTSSFTGWTLLSGATPSAPTLTN